MTPALSDHQARMRRVIDHIDRHLDDSLDLAGLSAVAAYSKFHFHRRFAATFGLSVHRYVQLLRLKRATHRLAYRADDSVTTIALDAGFAAPDAFARAFRQRLGQSPSSFRKRPDWDPWIAAFRPLDTARNTLMQKKFTRDEVEIRAVAAIPVAIVEHRGDPAGLGASLQRFIAWRKAAGLHPDIAPTFNVWRSERAPENPAHYSIDLCVGIAALSPERLREIDTSSVRIGEIPGGRCAVLRITGQTDNLEPAALYLYRDWLPASGEQLRDFPVYCERLRLYPDVALHEPVADLFLPLA